MDLRADLLGMSTQGGRAQVAAPEVPKLESEHEAMTL